MALSEIEAVELEAHVRRCSSDESEDLAGGPLESLIMYNTL
jgi:hypothetical protein